MHMRPPARTLARRSVPLGLSSTHAAGGARANGLWVPLFFLWRRMLSTTTGSAITEMILNSPPHGQHYTKAGAGDNQFCVKLGDLRKLAFAIGQALGVFRDNPTSKGCG